MKTSDKLFYWLPRLLCIAAILFISIFALDSFEKELSIGVQLAHFLKHLIPSFILTAFLIVAWKWEMIGGMIFTLVGLIMSPFVFQLNHIRNGFSIAQSLNVVLIITVPFILVGILFLESHYRKKRTLS
jgi:hypothetical protein